MRPGCRGPGKGRLVGEATSDEGAGGSSRAENEETCEEQNVGDTSC